MPGSLIPGNSALLAGPLGNVYVGFDGYNLGKTTEDTSLTKDEDVKDILFSQDGTKAADHVPTGMLMMLNATFGEISTALLKKVLYSFSSQAADDGSGDDSGTFGRLVYNSLRLNKARALRIWATDSNGDILETDENMINCYEAVPLIDENLINWGADTQRNLPVRFMIYFHEFGTARISGGPYGAFGYYGDPATEKVPATDWPDIAAPVLDEAEATSATNLDLTFDENVAFQGGSYSAGVVVKIDGDFVAPSSGSIASNVASFTFPASTFAAGQEIEVYISGIVFEDTETTPNVYPGIEGFPVTNSAP